ncbi:MAG TPA: CoA pyrophosphatase [Roseiflexaceae bacterium]|jgi:8-oxo-dGTP pyrophosphatase MutT (NUDIX family)|nr:CoA pyrophosphatase [Roseiflexaceae bacterium]
MSLSHSAQQWQHLAFLAAQPGPPIAPDELLIMRTLSGELARPLHPPAGATPRAAGVLILLYPDGDDVRLPLTVRSEALSNHRGEVSLPGGATDPDDDGPAVTALRECYEELGVDPRTVEVWGMLKSLYIPHSNFQITPVVGWRPEPPQLQVSLHEVSAVLTVSLRELLEPERVRVEQWHRRGMDMLVPFFDIAGHKVWGATALILSEFVARLRRVMNS